jgi:hypothetical protein
MNASEDLEEYDALGAALESASSVSSLHLIGSIKLLRRAQWPAPDVRLLPLLGKGDKRRETVLVHSAVLKAFEHFRVSMSSGFLETVTTQGASDAQSAEAASKVSKSTC